MTETATYPLRLPRSIKAAVERMARSSTGVAARAFTWIKRIPWGLVTASAWRHL